jgi:DNA-binding response OmpR family regulator
MTAKILLVEDDPAVRGILCEAIEFEGYDVTCVATCADARAALAAGGYGLLISDVRLTDGSGRLLAAQALKAGAKTILLSGHPDELQALEPGVIGVLKPSRLDVIITAIARQLAA